MTRIPAVLLLAMLFATNAFAQYTETIIVSRVVLDLRVTKANGEPVKDLKPEEFTIIVGGKPARVASATWVDDADFDTGEPPPLEMEDMDPAEFLALVEQQEKDEEDAARGRLFVAFVQTDFQRESKRVRGQLKFRSYARDLLRSFKPNDRVAVFSFDSHLKFRRDFTADKEDAANATGGFYASTANFPQQAIDRTKRTLQGRYDLELIVNESLGAGTHKVEASVKRRGTIVMAPMSVVISE